MNSAWLYRQSVHYLERFESTEEGVRRVLERRIRRRCMRTGEDEKDAIDGIAAVIQKLVKLDYVDDRRFAGHLVRRLRHRGGSRAQIRARMRDKGVPEMVIGDSLRTEAGCEEDAELRAAWIVARKRRIGPFRSEPLPEELDLRMRARKRELAIFGRRGFSFDIARQVLDATEVPVDPAY